MIEYCPRLGPCCRAFSSRVFIDDPISAPVDHMLGTVTMRPAPTSLLVPLLDLHTFLKDACAALPIPENASEYVDAVPFEQVSSLQVVRVRKESKQPRLDEDLSAETTTETREAAAEARRLGKLAKRALREPLNAEQVYQELTAVDRHRPRLNVFIAQMGRHELRQGAEVVSSGEATARGKSMEFKGAIVVEISAKVAAANFSEKSASLEIENAPSDHQLLQNLYISQARSLDIDVASDSDLRSLCAAMTTETSVHLRIIVDLKVTSKSLVPSARLIAVTNAQDVLRSLNDFLRHAFVPARGLGES